MKNLNAAEILTPPNGLEGLESLGFWSENGFIISIIGLFLFFLLILFSFLKRRKKAELPVEESFESQLRRRFASIKSRTEVSSSEISALLYDFLAYQIDDNARALSLNECRSIFKNKLNETDFLTMESILNYLEISFFSEAKNHVLDQNLLNTFFKLIAKSLSLKDE